MGVFRRSACMRAPPWLANVQLHEQGHEFRMCQVLGKGTCVVFCRKCGAYAETQPRGILRPCRAARSGQRHRLKAFAEGKHPTLKGRALSAPRRLPQRWQPTGATIVAEPQAAKPPPRSLGFDDPEWEDGAEGEGGVEEFDHDPAAMAVFWGMG